MLTALRVFSAAHGHADVPRSYVTETGQRLGVWVHRQRTLHTAGTLPDDRRTRLEDAGLRWSIADREAGLVAFAAFHKSMGNGLVPHTFRTADGFPLGTWVQSRRRQWAVDPQVAERLWPELCRGGFVWQVRDRDAAWVAGVDALRRYEAQHGDVLVPHWFVTDDGVQLGRWLDSRRVEYRAGVLAADRVDQLKVLGVVWRLRPSPDDGARRNREEAHFIAMVRRAGRWVRTHDGAMPRARDVDTDQVGVGRWLLRQRRQHRDGQLAPKRRATLDQSLPGWRRGNT